MAFKIIFFKFITVTASNEPVMWCLHWETVGVRSCFEQLKLALSGPEGLCSRLAT